MFPYLKVGVSSKESRSFLSPSKIGLKSAKKGSSGLPCEMIKYFYKFEEDGVTSPILSCRRGVKVGRGRRRSWQPRRGGRCDGGALQDGIIPDRRRGVRGVSARRCGAGCRESSERRARCDLEMEPLPTSPKERRAWRTVGFVNLFVACG